MNVLKEMTDAELADYTAWLDACYAEATSMDDTARVRWIHSEIQKRANILSERPVANSWDSLEDDVINLLASVELLVREYLGVKLEDLVSAAKEAADNETED